MAGRASRKGLLLTAGESSRLFKEGRIILFHDSSFVKSCGCGKGNQKARQCGVFLRPAVSEASTCCFSDELAAKQDLHFLSSCAVRPHCHLPSLGIVTSSLVLSHPVVQSCLIWSTCYYVVINQLYLENRFLQASSCRILMISINSNQ